MALIAEKPGRIEPIASGETRFGIERIDGTTPRGGAYMVVYYSDAQGNLAAKDDALFAEIHEFDADGKSIARTYAQKSL